MGKGKKGKRRDDDDDWENDIVDIAQETGIDLNQEESDVVINMPKKKEKKRKDKATKLKQEDADEDFDDSAVSQVTKASFNALILDDENGDDDGADEEDRSSEEEREAVEKVERPSDREAKKEKSGKADKKKGKGKKKKGEDEEDLDAILADIESSDKKDGKAESKKSKKKGKQKQDEAEANLDIAKEIEDDAGIEVGEVKSEDAKEESKGDEKEVKPAHEDHSDEEGPKIKTAAQKRAEKKERDKLKKKKEAKKKVDGKQDKKEEENDTAELKEKVSEKEDVDVPMQSVDEVTQEVAAAVEDAGSDEEGEDGDGDKKKKKKKKKKGKDEDEKKKGKKPGKTAIKQMQEALEKLKLEEERLRQEEEEKLKAAEEAEQQRLEKLRLEQERKERKKQKEKEKKEKRKKEGKLLTPAQKEQKRKAETQLQALKQQGIAIPSKEAVETRKKVQYGKKKKNQQVERQNSAPVQKDAATEAKEDLMLEAEELKAEQLPEVEDQLAKSNEEEEGGDLPDSWEDHHDETVATGKEVKNESEILKPSLMKEQRNGVKDVKEEPASEIPKEKAGIEEESSDGSKEEDDSEEDESEEDDSSGEGSSDEDSESSEDEHEKLTPERIKERARERIMKRRAGAEAKRSIEKLRSPVICVLGHVDTGKTKILDKIRHTNVQDGEAGGITQQIGATMVPLDTLKTQTKMIKEFQKFDLKLPGLLIIDTPGHESFSNLRTRGSSLCDMAILVVDIMHGLEPQTIESINLLRKKHTPFIVALNKIDRLFEWKRGPASQVDDTIKKQKRNTKTEFESRVQQIIGEFAEQGLNAELFYKNFDEKNYISLVPTSAHSGDGMGDLMALISKLTQTRLAKKLAYSEELQSTVMEVKALPGLGTTVDAILVNGKLREGDTIVTGGIDGPIVTQIRAVLTPQPLRELRVKSNYIQHKELQAAQGCKITGKDLEKVMAGAPIFVAEHPDEIDVLKDEVHDIVRSSLKAIKVSDRGVYVQASTLGSLEALLEFLKTSKIPYSGVNVGPVHKRDVMKTSVMLEHEPMYAVLLAFDVKVERDAQELADKEGVKIFTADIIYHLFDKFTAYTEEYKQKQKDKYKHLAVFPCKLRVLPQHIFNSRDPIVLGVNIESGTLRVGTPITVPSKEFCDIGVVSGIEANHKTMDKASTGQEVCVKIDSTGDAPRMYGRHFTDEDVLMSKISRESIDALKDYYRDEMTKADWQLIIEMKKIFEIM